MKTFLKLFIVIIFLSSGSIYAQKILKIGHINSATLMDAMPEKAEADAALLTQQNSMRDQLDAMTVDFNKLYDDYLTKADSLQPLIRTTKEQELEDLQTRIKSFQTTADQALRDKQAELYNPIVEKARNAIQEVAKEQNYSYIFDTNPQATSVLYFPEDSDDILPLVKTKLGIKE